MRNDLFEPIVAMFVSNGNRYNMIHSGNGLLDNTASDPTVLAWSATAPIVIVLICASSISMAAAEA